MNAPMTDKPVPALGYDSVPPEGYVSRRKYRFLLVLTVCNTLLLLGLVAGPLAWRLAREARARQVARQAAALAQAQQAQAQAQLAAAQAQAAAARRTATVAAPRVPQWQLDRQQRQALAQRLLSQTRPSEQAVYDEDPVAARKLLASDASSPLKYRAVELGNIDSTYRSSFQPPVFSIDVPSMSPFSAHAEGHGKAVLFVHGLTSASGNKRVVFLDLATTTNGMSLSRRQPPQEYEIRLERQLQYRIFDPGDASGNSVSRDLSLAREGPSLKVRTTGADVFPVRWVDGVLRTDREAGKSLRFFAGLPDPKDPSHFTVDYEFDGQRGTVDGWLTDDDFLRIRPQGGEVEGGIWYVNGKPAAGSGQK